MLHCSAAAQSRDMADPARQIYHHDTHGKCCFEWRPTRPVQSGGQRMGKHSHE